MLDYIKAFNREIASFLNDTPNSSAAATIEKIRALYPEKANDYERFDSLGYKVGLEMSTTLYEDEEGRNKGWISQLYFLPKNKLGEKPGAKILEKTPLKQIECYRVIAKAMLYRFMQLDLNQYAKH